MLLFELRLFKSRSQSSSAIQSGRVLLNGTQVKPSREAHAGDRVTLARAESAGDGDGPVHTRTLEILELPTRSLSKEAARQLVREL